MNDYNRVNEHIEVGDILIICSLPGHSFPTGYLPNQ